MTWEDIYKKLCQFAIYEDSPLANNIKIVLEGELHNKVIIEKGESRHQYAYVLHEWIEGAEIQVKLDGNWSDYLCSRSYIDKFEYRIKPSEPVYEWQWMQIRGGKAYVSDGWYINTSELCANETEFWNICVTTSIEATKQERKNA